MTNEPSWMDRSPLKFHELALIGAIIAVFFATAFLDRNHTYFNDFQGSAVLVMRNVSYLGIIALGSALVIIAGGIDLSAGAMVATSATVCALIMTLLADPSDTRLSQVGTGVALLGIAGGIFSGFLVGTLHTWLITAIKLPPFVATLATLVGLRSFAYALCNYVTEVHHGTAANYVAINAPFFMWLNATPQVSFAVFIVLAVITGLILNWTVLGRHLYALGGNEQAAMLSGIQTENVKWFAYCFGSITASIGGIFAMANVSNAQPDLLGLGIELNAIAAAVVGGCSLTGGVGTVSGVMLGTLFLRLIIDAVSKVIKSNAKVYEGMVVGVVVALAVTFTQFRQLVASGRQFFPGIRGWFAIVTLGLGSAILFAMVTKDVEAFKGMGFGIALGVGVVVWVGLTIVKLMELSRASSED